LQLGYQSVSRRNFFFQSKHLFFRLHTFSITQLLKYTGVRIFITNWQHSSKGCTGLYHSDNALYQTIVPHCLIKPKRMLVKIVCHGGGSLVGCGLGSEGQCHTDTGQYGML
jgi:hypothetical protein